MDIKYLIADSFESRYNSISIGGLGYDKLKDYEQDILISDCITHEFIHTLLENTFNKVTSQLFDFIGDSLLNTSILQRAISILCDARLWSTAIKEDGISWIYNEYRIDNSDLIQAFIITRGK